VTIGFYPGRNSAPLSPGKTGLDTSGIDLRQNFLTFGDKSWGTDKVGKDIGLFASDAILADMTLLGVGSGGGAFLGGNPTLGGIGQKVKARTSDVPVLPSGANVSGTGFDIGAKVYWGALDGVLYAYAADGIGTTAIGFNGASFASGRLEKRKSKGWYAQGTYK